ncbi:MAG: hypothetical protein ACK4GO_17980 [Gemmobacter sp.]
MKHLSSALNIRVTLLDEICAAPLLTEASLTGAGALASAPVVKGRKAKAAAQPGLFDSPTD